MEGSELGPIDCVLLISKVIRVVREVYNDRFADEFEIRFRREEAEIKDESSFIESLMKSMPPFLSVK